MRKRFFRILKRYLIVLGAGILYFVFTTVTKIGIPCPFRLVTGFLCPGCGISRMMIALANFDFVSAFHHNPFILLTSPIILFIVVYSDYRYIKTGDGSFGKWKFLLIAELAGLLIFGVARNMI
ncbi:MAG: DUF2752 domain-containing protein [Ruminococcaceae bacterium]|nr:DUF2752 domain-containing protein [Oscillospiraceae bacterium]